MRAQVQDGGVINGGDIPTVTSQAWNTSSGVSNEAEMLFKSLLPQQDSILLGKKPVYEDNLRKRFSLHFNLVDWALTVPSVGVEFDLNKTVKNNKSLIFTLKGNPKTPHNYTPAVRLDLLQASLELRKYWRTGSVGLAIDHGYSKINLKRGKTKKVSEPKLDDYGDTISIITRDVYVSEEDSLIDTEYNGDKNRSQLYNMYHMLRRNLTSTRTVQNPRNWRAYYLGAYLSAEKWNMCIFKKGNKGYSATLGMSLGWSIPLLEPKFPRESGLDLDLGLVVGVRALLKDPSYYGKYDYVFDPSTNKGNYHMTSSVNQFTLGFAKTPLQEVHVSLVYRFRNISRKVSRAIIDDYQKDWVDKFEQRKMELQNRLDSIDIAKRDAADAKFIKDNALADSASYADWWNKRRLENAKILNPDTVFNETDSVLYFKLVKGIDFDKMSAKQIKQYKDSIATDLRNAKKKALEEERKAKKAALDSAKTAQKLALDSAKMAQKQAADSIRMAKKEAQVAIKAAQDSLRSAEKAAADSAKAAILEASRLLKEQKKAEADSIKAAKAKALEEIANAKKAEKEAKKSKKSKKGEEPVAEEQSGEQPGSESSGSEQSSNENSSESGEQSQLTSERQIEAIKSED